jgi:hypothetical protein
MPHNRTDEDNKRAFEDGSSGATADMATDRSLDEQRHIETPHVQSATPLQPNEKPDQLADRAAGAESRQEALLDEAVEETFPGSDPISPKHIT